MSRIRGNGMLLLLFSLGAHAAELPVVQVEVEPAVVTVGEPVTLRIAVFAPTWFPQPPSFPSFELPNTITRLPPNSSGPVSQRVGHTTWSGVQRRYQIFPLISGQFRIRGRTLVVTYADPQSPRPLKLELPIPDIVFDSQVPPGAQALDPYLAGRMLELQRVAGGDLQGLQAGDALEIRYRAVLEGMPSLFLPPLALIPEQQGLSVYTDEPVLRDEDGKAVREETVTLVFDRGGSYTLPSLQLHWWNLHTSAVVTTSLDALTIEIAAATGTEPVSVTRDWSLVTRWLLLSILLLVLAFALLRKPLATWRAARRLARAGYLRSEAYAFVLLTRALQSSDLRESYHCLLRWLSLLDAAADLDSFCLQYGDAELTRQVNLLRDRLFNDSSSEPDCQRLLGLCRVARSARFEDFGLRQPLALPPLNP